MTYLLITARSSVSRNIRGLGLPGCGWGVMDPTSTNPNPRLSILSTASPFLSNPAANPIGFSNCLPQTVVFWKNTIHKVHSRNCIPDKRWATYIDGYLVRRINNGISTFVFHQSSFCRKYISGLCNMTQGLYSNKEIKFQYIPVYSRMDKTKFPGHFWRGITQE